MEQLKTFEIFWHPVIRLNLFENKILIGHYWWWCTIEYEIGRVKEQEGCIVNWSRGDLDDNHSNIQSYCSFL